MAATVAHVFVPAVAAILFMLGDVHGHLAFTPVAATVTFVGLGLLTGLFWLAGQCDLLSAH